MAVRKKTTKAPKTVCMTVQIESWLCAMEDRVSQYDDMAAKAKVLRDVSDVYDHAKIAMDNILRDMLGIIE